MSTSTAITRKRNALHSYIAGFALSVTLTLVAYAMVTRPTLSHHAILVAIISLALVQFIVQLFFFLHLGSGTKARWKLYILFNMILVVAILVFGSLWIMSNLNYRMTPTQINTYLKDQDGL